MRAHKGMDGEAGEGACETTNRDAIRRRVSLINTKPRHNALGFYDALSKDILRERAKKNNEGEGLFRDVEGSIASHSPRAGRSFVVDGARRRLPLPALLFVVLVLAFVVVPSLWDHPIQGMGPPPANTTDVADATDIAAPLPSYTPGPTRHEDRPHGMLPWDDSFRGRVSQAVRVGEMTRYIVGSADVDDGMEEVRGEAEGGRPVSSVVGARRTEVGVWRHASSPPLERLHPLESAMRRHMEADPGTPCTCAREWGYLLRAWAFRAPGPGVGGDILLGYNCAVLDPSDASAGDEGSVPSWGRRGTTPRSRVTLYNHAVYPDRLPAPHDMLNAVLLRCDTLSPVGAVESALVTDRGVAWCLQACAKLDAGVPLFDRW